MGNPGSATENIPTELKKPTEHQCVQLISFDNNTENCYNCCFAFLIYILQIVHKMILRVYRSYNFRLHMSLSFCHRYLCKISFLYVSVGDKMYSATVMCVVIVIRVNSNTFCVYMFGILFISLVSLRYKQYNHVLMYYFHYTFNSFAPHLFTEYLVKIEYTHFMYILSLLLLLKRL